MSDQLRKELQAEYAIVQGQYEAFDQRALGLKALAAPLLGAGLAAGVAQEKAAVLVVTILAALGLWVLEVVWKSFQHCYRPRLEALEAWFRGAGPVELAPFQIDAWWSREWRDQWQGRLARPFLMAWEPFIALPYALVVGAGLAAIVWLGWS